MARVEAADARAEEAADLAPARRDDAPGGGQADADVELPERPPEPARHGELEHRDRPAGPHDARELAQRRRGIVDVAQEIGERERVELAVVERQLLGAALAQLDARREAGALDARAAGREHLGALVDARRRVQSGCARASSIATAAVPRRDVEHARRVRPATRETRNRRQRGSCPNESSARVAVVGRPERREELARVARSRGGLGQETESTISRWR